MAAITTYLGIQRNFKILVLDTKHNDYFYQDCYLGNPQTLSVVYIKKWKNREKNEKKVGKSY